MRIKNVFVKEIFDSRADPTIEVVISDERGKVYAAQVPSGKSRGKQEAAVLDFAAAKSALGQISPKLIGPDFRTLEELDSFLVQFDGTERKERLGGNLIIGISMAFSRALAAEKSAGLSQFLHDEFFKDIRTDTPPWIFSNFINGGAHATNNLDIQEYIVILKTKPPVKESIRTLIALYRDAGAKLKEKNHGKPVPIGDEGGYAMDFVNNFEPITILEERIRAAKMDDECNLGLDAAASNFYEEKNYRFDGKTLDSQKLTDLYLEYKKRSPLLYSLEDPFAEDDLLSFKRLKEKLPAMLIIGDDLTVTNPALIQRFAKDGMMSGVIIKPNQIGTVTETCRAIRASKESGLKVIISHRSGETEDNFIIHLAKASAADGVKIGAPVRERILKFNELIRLYDRSAPL